MSGELDAARDALKKEISEGKGVRWYEGASDALEGIQEGLQGALELVAGGPQHPGMLLAVSIVAAAREELKKVAP